MDYNKPFNFLKNLPPKLNLFYKKKSKSGLVVSNKSKSKKNEVKTKKPPEYRWFLVKSI